MTPSIDELFAENYTTMGATGKGAIQSMWDDFAEGRLTDPDWLQDINATEEEIVRALVAFTLDIVNNGYLHHTFE